MLFRSFLFVNSCGITSPSEEQWQDVSSFSWPTKVGTLMRYRTEADVNGSKGVSNEDFSIQISNKDSYKGRYFFQMKEKGGSSGNNFGFIHLNKDTLITMNVPYAKYALVGPLDKDKTWISDYKDDIETIPLTRATVIEKLSELQLEGVNYHDIVVVKYELIDINSLDEGDIISSYIRSYAKGVGAIQTIENSVPRRKSPVNNQEYLISSSVLLETVPSP